MTRRAYLLLLPLLLLALACKPEKDPIAATIDAVADAAEERDAAAVMRFLGAGFPNRGEVETQLRRYFFGYKTIEIVVRDVNAQRSGSTAWATFLVDFVGLPKNVGGFDQYLPRTAKYRFEVTLAEEGGEWKITSAKYEREEGRN